MDGAMKIFPDDRRDGKRSRVAMHASVSARGSIDSFDCLVRDATREGCRIVTSLVKDLPNEIWLTLQGVREPLEGRIIWRKGKQAGVEFIWDDADDILA
jgi:hypothetical protein